MKLSVSAYRAHASAHKKILSSSYQTQLNYGSTAAAASSSASTNTSGFFMEPIDVQKPTTPSTITTNAQMEPCHGGIKSPSEQLLSPGGTGTGTVSIATSREEEDSSNQNSSDCKSPAQRAAIGKNVGRRNAVTVLDGILDPLTKSNQRWMKLRTTVQISSAIAPKKPPLKREDSFLKRFSTRQIPETQETVEDTGSEGPDQEKVYRRRRRRIKPPKTVVNPDENFYFYWLMVLTLMVLYNFWTLIVRQSFPELQQKASTFWFVMDCVSDLVFILDVAVQFRTGYLEQGLMVYDGKKLAGHYLHSKAFLFDLVSLIPLDILQVRFGTQPLLRFPRFFKVYRAVKYYYIVESRTVWPNLWRVVNLIHILLILAHWFGCFYYLLSEAEDFQGDWVYPFRPGDYSTLTRKYLGSLYWSTLTLTTIGDLPTPETNAEPSTSADGPRSLPKRGIKSRLLQYDSNTGYIFTIVSYLIGVFIFATIVGQVGNVITNRNANRLEFERLLDGAKTYMRHHKVPGGMKKRVLRWYDYSWSRGRIQGGGDINTALGLLPDKLKTELALHVNLSVLKKVTIFQECQPEFLHDLVLKMKAYIFTPGDSICRKGEVAREMFIIADGILEVLSETGKVLTTMKAGDFFGEIGILNLDGLNKRTADVRSVGYSELFSLSREDVLAAMKDYPEAQEILQTLGRKRLMEVRCVNKKHAAKREAALAHEAHGHQNAQGDSSDNSASKRIVDKLKSDVKGLKNVLRKTRGSTHRRSDESIELQPLQQPKAPKGVLRRMQRVKSDDLNGDEDDSIKEEKKEICSPIGAGLPLLQRLRLLKEKQDREERAAKHSTPPVVSPPHTHVSTISPQESIQEEPEPEVIGAGLPLLQRLKLLKAKEENGNKDPNQSKLNVLSHATASRKSSLSPTSPTVKTPHSALHTSESGISRSHLRVSFRDKIRSLKQDTKDDKFSGPESTDLKQHLIPSFSAKLKKPSTTQALKDKIKTFSGMPKEEPMKPWSKLKLATVGGSYTSLNNASTDDSPKLSKSFRRTSTPDNLNIVSTRISPIKELPKSEQVTSVSDSELKSETSTISNKVKKKPKPLKIIREPKNYRSVDDLSPEYSGLPFVKKLKILNERQKLAELESVIQTRSFSLDCTDSSNSNEIVELMTRSQSEASCVIAKPKISASLVSPVVPVAPLNFIQHPPRSPVSPESNETLERKNLKSILKKLSEDRLAQRAPPFNLDNQQDFKRLMRAQTLEGYVARHSKFLKSVTFNNTISSPPNSTTTIIDESESTTDNTQPLYPISCAQSSDVSVTQSDISTSDLDKSTNRFNYPDTISNIMVSTTETETRTSSISTSTVKTIEDATTKLSVISEECNQKRVIKGSMEEQEYYTDILLGIKQMIQNHLKDLQGKFHDKIINLELEVQRREMIINDLQTRLRDVENPDDAIKDSERENQGESGGSTGSSNELPFMRGDSLDTIFATSPPSEYEMQRKSRRRKISPRQFSSRSWDESSDQESFEFDDHSHKSDHSKSSHGIVVSNLTGNLIADSVVLNMEDDTELSSSSNESHSDEENEGEQVEPSVAEEEEEEEGEEDEEEEMENGGNDWEVRMLAAELEKRQSVTDIDESDGLLRRRKKRSDTDTDISESEMEIRSRPRASSFDQHNVRNQYKCRGVFKAMSFDRDKDRL